MIFNIYFWFQRVFLPGYFIEVITERIADSPHPKSFSEQFSRDVKDLKALVLMGS
jgi:hypothetical protein